MAPATTVAKSSGEAKAESEEHQSHRFPTRLSDDEILELPSPRRTNFAKNASSAAADQVKNSAQKETPDCLPGIEVDEEGPTRAEREVREAEKSDLAAGEITDPATSNEVSQQLRLAFEENPELETAWEQAKAYREAFATPEEARKATGLLADLDRMDALFFSQKAEDHDELARSLASLDPVAFASLARAMGQVVANSRQGIKPHDGKQASSGAEQSATGPGAAEATTSDGQQTTAVGTNAQIAAREAFLLSVNASTVEGVLNAIESQVERLLPEGISKSARSRVVGEIYRELDVTLRGNRQLMQQMREAFRKGSLDTEHERAIVTLITGRARQALPAVAKRVMNEWTTTLLAADHDRRNRQRSAERRVDIAGSSGNASEGRKTASPRAIDYARMSDSDILNL